MYAPRGASCLLALVAIGLTAPSAWAADVELAVVPGFDGHVKTGVWMPVTVICANRGRKTSGELAIEARGEFRRTTFTTPVELPAYSNLAYTLYVLLEQVENNELPVVLRPRGGRPVVKKATVKLHQPTDKLILLLSRDPGGLIGAAGLQVPVTPTPSVSDSGEWLGAPPGAPIPSPPGYYEEWTPQPAWTNTLALPTRLADVITAPFNVTTATGAGGRLGLPDRAIGYHGVDVVVLHNFSVDRLTRNELAALQTWVRRGGTLVVCYAGAVADVQGAVMQELLPVEVAEERLLTTANSLGQRYGVAMPTTPPFLAASGPLRHGIALAGTRGFPLLSERPYGCGRVLYLALDPQKQPVRSWPQGQRELWRDIVLRRPSLRPAEFAPDYEDMYGAGRQNAVAKALVQIPQMRAPSFLIVGLFLFLYVVCVVPLNYIVLRRLDKREWAWATVPGIVLVFTVGAYLAGYTLKGGSVLYREADICSTQAGSDSAVRDGYFGVFSPARATYDVVLPRGADGVAEAYVTRQALTGGYEVTQGAEFSLPDLLIHMWDMRVFHALSDMDLGGGLETTMEVSRSGIEGRVTNRTRLDLRGTCLLWRGTGITIGALPRGSSQRFRLPVGGAPANPTAAVSELGRAGQSASDIAQEVVQAVLGSGGGLVRGVGADEVLLAAWVPKAPSMGIRLEPKPRREVHGALLLAVLPIGDDSGTFEIPRNMTMARVVDADVKREDLQLLSGREMPQGTYVFDVRLPLRGSDLVFSRMNVLFEYQPRLPKQPSLEVFDYASRQWRRLPMAVGVNIQPLADPQRYVRLPDASVRLRVHNPNDKQQPRLTNLTVTCAGRRR